MASLVETKRDSDLAKTIFERIASDLAMIVDRPLSVASVECVRAREKVVAGEGVHLAFRIEISVDGRSTQGCILLPLPEAIAVACFLMVMPDEVVTGRRESKHLDRFAKEAMLEIGNFVAGSTDAVLRSWLPDREVSARSAGCQGVPSGSQPNFRFTKGQELIVARVRMSLHDYPAFEAVAMLPALANG